MEYNGSVPEWNGFIFFNVNKMLEAMRIRHANPTLFARVHIWSWIVESGSGVRTLGRSPSEEVGHWGSCYRARKK